MNYITMVKAGNITNLTNARYCAGMFVDLIGFPIGKDSPFLTDSQKIIEIKNWLVGIPIVLEILDETVSAEKIKELMDEIKPDYLQLPSTIYQIFKGNVDLPLIVKFENEKITPIQASDIRLINVDMHSNLSILKTVCEENKTILHFKNIPNQEISRILTMVSPFGIEIKGQEELKTGLKSFDEFIDLLDLLEKKN